MEPTSPDADVVERALVTTRRVVVPVLAVLLVVAAVTAGALRQNDVAAQHGLRVELATVVATEPAAGSATVTWTGADGRIELGTVALTAGLGIGASTHVVSGPDGRLTDAALPAQARSAAVVRAAEVLGVGGAVLTLLFLLLRHLGRVRAGARLDDEWRAVERQWRTDGEAAQEAQ